MKYEVTKEQILEAHADACNEWKEKLEEWFPKVFEQKCEVGKWYWASEKAKRDKTCLFYYNNEKTTYGFDWSGSWANDLNSCEGEVTGIEAKDIELECLFFKEACNRYGNSWQNLFIKYDLNGSGENVNDEVFTPAFGNNVLWNKNGEVFFEGKWAETLLENKPVRAGKLPNPVEVSKSDIAKLMNVEVSNLKIVD
ncbi:hypothetical protein HZQ15_18575 [Elizabethkingia anophelis]|nr:hypothetical protein [Elizabethkingia anophelis]MCT4042807.1 hypothetical protein [Elizabethkingia anophelis]